MTKRDLVSAALKVYGVILIAQTVIGSVMYIQLVITAAQGNFYPKQSAGGMVAAWICYVVISLLLGLSLVMGGDRIARLVVGEDAPVPSIDLRRDARMVLSLALTVFGVVLTVSAITGLLGEVAKHLMSIIYAAHSQNESVGSVTEAYSSAVWSAMWNQVVRSALGLILGLYLAIRGHSLAGLLMRDREEPTPKEQT